MTESTTPRTDAVMEQPHLDSLLDELEQHARTLETELRAAVDGLSEGIHVPEGWALVPVVPTQEMLVMGLRTFTDAFGSPLTRVLAEYQAMLATAPKVPK